MGNCLVTKLKGVVDNDDLKKFGVISLYFPPMPENMQTFPAAIFSENDGDCVATVVDSVLGVIGTITTTVWHGENFITYPFRSPNGGYMEITNKYKLTRCFINGVEQWTGFSFDNQPDR